MHDILEFFTSMHFRENSRIFLPNWEGYNMQRAGTSSDERYTFPPLNDVYKNLLILNPKDYSHENFVYMPICQFINNWLLKIRLHFCFNLHIAWNGKRNQKIIWDF